MVERKLVNKNIKVDTYDRTVNGVVQRVKGYNYDRNVIDRTYLSKKAKKKITKDKAKQLFENKSPQSQYWDVRKNAKQMFIDPNEYWRQEGSYCDILGIDGFVIPEVDKLPEDALSGQVVMYQGRVHLADDAGKWHAKKGKTETKEQEEETRKILTPFEKKFKKAEGWRYKEFSKTGFAVVDKQNIALFTTKEEYDNLEFLKSQTQDAKHVTLDKTEVVLQGGDINLISFGDDESCYLKGYLDQAIKLMDNPKIFYKKDHPLILKDDNFVFALAPRAGTINEEKLNYRHAKIPYSQYQQDTKKLTKKQLEEKLKKLDPELEMPKSANKDALIMELHLAIKEEEKKEEVGKLRGSEKDKAELMRMKEKFKKNMKKKIDREIYEEQPITDFGHFEGIMEPSRVTLLMTNQQFNKSNIIHAVEGRELVPFDTKNAEFAFYGDFQLYSFDENEDNYFSKEYVDLAMKSMDKPKIYYKKDHPLVIQDDTMTYLVAPRVNEDISFDDEEEFEAKVEGKKTIKLTPSKYKELMKTNKADMIAEWEKLENQLSENKDYEVAYNAKNKVKADVLYDLMRKREEYHYKKVTLNQKIKGMKIKEIESRIKKGDEIPAEVQKAMPKELKQKHDKKKILVKKQTEQIEDTEKELFQLKQDLEHAESPEFRGTSYELSKLKIATKEKRDYLNSLYRDYGWMTTEKKRDRLRDLNANQYLTNKDIVKELEA